MARGVPRLPICSQIITIDEAKRRQSFGSGEGEVAACGGLPLLSDAGDLLQDTHVEKVDGPPRHTFRSRGDDPFSRSSLFNRCFVVTLVLAIASERARQSGANDTKAYPPD